MKKVLTLLFGAFLATAAMAQTAEEIISHMEEVMDAGQDKGLVMTMDMKIPIVGTFSTTAYALGDKMCMEGNVAGKRVIAWMDSTTSWTYDVEANTIEIENRDGKSSEAEDNAKMLDGITDGYGVSVKKQTADAWYITCKKLRTNTNKDDPRTMELVVAKGSYMPVSLSATVSLVTVTIRNLAFGVNESQVTFVQSNYPGVMIVDKR